MDAKNTFTQNAKTHALGKLPEQSPSENRMQETHSLATVQQ